MKQTNPDRENPDPQPDNELKTALLITAAGNSSRFSENHKKQFFPFYGETVLHHTFIPFLKMNIFDFFCLTVPPGYLKEAEYALGKRLVHTLGDKLTITEGGATRQESVLFGLRALEKKSPDMILIHDGARPRVTSELISRIYETTKKHRAAAPVIPSVDAMKTINPDGTIKEHLDRPVTVGIQTPQGYFFNDILSAYNKAENDGYGYIDDSEIYHRYAGDVYTVQGDPENAKITYFSDITPEESGIS